MVDKDDGTPVTYPGSTQDRRQGELDRTMRNRFRDYFQYGDPKLSFDDADRQAERMIKWLRLNT